jgi:predicted pyridoxine 5'-phosphate oxidase superfamily flavin-nucleotide-binding protein
VIEPEAAELLESPCAMIVGTVDADGLPDATRGWGFEVLEPDEARVLLSSNATITLDNLRTTGVIALTVTHFSTLVSYQVKGRASSIEPATAEDRIRFDTFCAGCIHDLHEIDGTAVELIERLRPPGIIAVLISVESVFDQTPGPAAGAKLAPVEASS